MVFTPFAIKYLLLAIILLWELRTLFFVDSFGWHVTEVIN